MKIAFDISPLVSDSQHTVRGAGFYISNLRKSLEKYFPDNDYTFFDATGSLPADSDILHIPYFEPFFLSLPFVKQYTTVVTIHDLIPIIFKDTFPSGIRGILKWSLQKFLLSFVDGIITDSTCSKKDINRLTHIPLSKIHVVYLAADESFRKLSSQSVQYLRKKYSLPQNFVLYVGDITGNKNIPRLIEAIEQIGLPLVLVGKAITENDFDKKNPWNKDRMIVQEKIADSRNIHALGFIPTQDLVGLYNIATVFVMPSLYEGFGLPVLEAMACGCPVITTQEGSLAEIAGEAAYYVNPYDTNDIAKGIDEVFKNSQLRKKLSIQGQERVKEFSWRKTAGNTIEVYKAIKRE
ncbi:MAG TPA: glycosyltransferase family 1 protein [Candidatus Saccharimonadales bacterium]|nr:glycosyltransferase family 1 protein [Candidatus Saccharimonadales bacterium]